jgi:hypothetical protein
MFHSENSDPPSSSSSSSSSAITIPTITKNTTPPLETQQKKWRILSTAAAAGPRVAPITEDGGEFKRSRINSLMPAPTRRGSSAKNRNNSIIAFPTRRNSSMIEWKRRPTQWKGLESPADPNQRRGSNSIIDRAVLSLKLAASTQNSTPMVPNDDYDEDDSGDEDFADENFGTSRRGTCITVNPATRQKNSIIEEDEEEANMLLSTAPIKRTSLQEKIMQ